MTEFDSRTNGVDVVRAFPEEVEGRSFLITGPSKGGIGAETAISLARGSPSFILLLGRSPAKAQPTIDSIQAIDPSIQVKFLETDLSFLASVRRTAQQILDDPEIKSIDAMINNAAIMACPLARSEGGIEMQLASNHLGHFVLANKLVPKLKASARAGGGVVVNVSSAAHKYSNVQFSDPNFQSTRDDDDDEAYSPWKGYGQSKTAQILFSVALNKRGIRSFAVHPGSISSNLQAYLTEELVEDITWKIYPQGVPGGAGRLKTLHEGCATQLVAALDPGLDAMGGVYLNDCGVTRDPVWLAEWALDEEGAERCWEMSEELAGEKFGV